MLYKNILKLQKQKLSNTHVSPKTIGHQLPVVPFQIEFLGVQLCLQYTTD